MLKSSVKLKYKSQNNNNNKEGTPPLRGRGTLHINYRSCVLHIIIRAKIFSARY